MCQGDTRRTAADTLVVLACVASFGVGLFAGRLLEWPAVIALVLGTCLAVCVPWRA